MENIIKIILERLDEEIPRGKHKKRSDIEKLCTPEVFDLHMEILCEQVDLYFEAGFKFGIQLMTECLH